MCGIFGFADRSPAVAAMMPFLALEMVNRGRDSWGVTDGINVLKKIGPIVDSWKLPSWGNTLVFHTRAGSVGEKTIKNQHPFVFRQKDAGGNPTEKLIVGVHNGGISNHEELNNKYDRRFAVDSMHIFAHIAENRDIEELRGYGAVVWFETEPNKEPVLRLARSNMHDLHVFKINGKSLVFCSTASPVTSVAHLFGWSCIELTLDADAAYTVTREGEDLLLVKGEKFSISTTIRDGRTQNYSNPSYRGSYYAPSQRSFDHYDDDLDTLLTNSSESVIEQWIKLTRTTEEEFDFTKRLPEKDKNSCRKCNSPNAIKRGRELICPECLLRSIKRFTLEEKTFEFTFG